MENKTNMKPLSKEEIVRIFAMYLNCDLYYEPEYAKIHRRYSNEKGKLMLNTYMLNDINDGIFLVTSFKLILKPLTSISDEQILHLCKFVCPNEFGDFRYSNWTITESTSNDRFQHNKEIRNEKTNYHFEIDLIDGCISLYEQGETSSSWFPPSYRDWYFINHFAVPLHPYGQNAVELGIAVYPS